MRFRFLTAVVLIAACSDGTGPGPAIVFATGDNQVDTVGTFLPHELVVRVVDAPPRTAIQYQTLVPDAIRPDLHGVGIWIARHATQAYSDHLEDSTDAFGRSFVRVRLGTIAGTAGLLVYVPALNLRDTARFTVLPGNGAGVAAFPKDTALFAGHGFQAHASVTDQFGNPRAGSVQYEDVAGNITVSPGGAIAATSIGRGTYIARAGSWVDTGYISVVPSAVIAAMRFRMLVDPTPTIVMFQLDGSALQLLTALPQPGGEDPNPRWAPDGSSLVYSAGLTIGSQGHLYAVTVTGMTTRLITQPPADLVGEMWPDVSHNGAYVYFTGRSPTNPVMIWRVASDGSGAVRISPDSVAATNHYEGRPAPSPDGGRLAYVTNVVGGTAIRVRYFTGDSTSSWSVAGNTPRWDPSRDRLAYVRNLGGPISVVNADGSGQTVITAPGRVYDDRTFDWSPDGEWIIARGERMLELINVSSGLTLPLGYSAEMFTPVWRP